MITIIECLNVFICKSCSFSCRIVFHYVQLWFTESDYFTSLTSLQWSAFSLFGSLSFFRRLSLFIYHSNALKLTIESCPPVRYWNQTSLNSFKREVTSRKRKRHIVLMTFVISVVMSSSTYTYSYSSFSSSSSSSSSFGSNEDTKQKRT